MQSLEMFVRCLRSEWIKQKRSLAFWLTIVGALFTPCIVLAARLLRYRTLPTLYAADDFWQSMWRSSWESMAVFFLPMAAILATSLIAQIEYRNNAWKQVCALPLSSATLYFGKLLVVLALIAQFFVFFDVSVYISAVIPCLLRLAPYPHAPLPLHAVLVDTAQYAIATLPIVCAEYLLSIQFKNFLVPVGVGFLAWVAALASLSWKYGYLIPYAYSIMTYLQSYPKQALPVPALPLGWLACAYTMGFCMTGYVLFIRKRVRG